MKNDKRREAAGQYTKRKWNQGRKTTEEHNRLRVYGRWPTKTAAAVATAADRRDFTHAHRALHVT